MTDEFRTALAGSSAFARHCRKCLTTASVADEVAFIAPSKGRGWLHI